jgi:phosphate transport system substrate-binding protein
MIVKKASWTMSLAAVGAALMGTLVAGCGSSDTSSSSTGVDTGSSATNTTPKDKGTGGDVSGALTVDGSTTVYPIVSAMGEDYGTKNSGVKVTVNKSGTGSGFQKFERGEIDIASASRPIKADEDAALKAKGIDYVELPIAFDGVSVVVNPQNTWAKNVTLDQLKKAWGPGSTVKLWSDIDPSFPKEKINFYGPSDNHGTYEYFTEAVCGKKNTIRADYQPNQEYTAIIKSVSDDKDGIAYVGYNYFDQNKDKVRALTVNGVGPAADTILDGSYTPLSRPLFIYVAKKALDKPAVKGFIEYALSDEGLGAVTEAKYVQLPKDVYEVVRKRATDGTPGSVFKDAKPGMKIADVLSKESAK